MQKMLMVLAMMIGDDDCHDTDDDYHQQMMKHFQLGWFRLLRQLIHLGEIKCRRNYIYHHHNLTTHPPR